MFTSDLTINGFAICDQLELTPLAQVMGSSIYQVGYQQSTWPMMMGGTVLTELSVADYSKLVRSGFEPLGIVAWSSVFFVAYGFNPMLERGMSLGQGLVQNFELTAFTQALYSAREQVMANLGRQAEALRASGVVGVRIAHSMERRTISGGIGLGTGGERSGLAVTFHAIGTAIRETEQATIWPPEPTIDLTT